MIKKKNKIGGCGGFSARLESTFIYFENSGHLEKFEINIQKQTKIFFFVLLYNEASKDLCPGKVYYYFGRGNLHSTLPKEIAPGSSIYFR